MILKGNVLVKKIVAPIYRTSIWIVVGKSVPESMTAIEEHLKLPPIFPDEEKPTVRALTYFYHYTKSKCRIILFFDQKSAPGTIAHECLHAQNYIFQYCGVKRDRNNDEHECYYLDLLVNKVHNTIQASQKLK